MFKAKIVSDVPLDRNENPSPRWKKSKRQDRNDVRESIYIPTHRPRDVSSLTALTRTQTTENYTAPWVRRYSLCAR